MNSTFLNDFFELTKPRICLLALTMAALGFYLGAPGSVDTVKLVFTLLGLALVGASTGTLNQFLEKDVDGKMWRTMDRPLPSGRLATRHALLLGYITGFVGEMVLLFFTNPVTTVLGGCTLFFYLAVYTPSKRVSSLSTLVGAIPGALPPLMGYTASHGTLGPMGFLLFVILFLWQIPHFLAIAWIYKEDYARAHLPILSVVDNEGVLSAKHTFQFLFALLPLSMLPSLWGVTGQLYFWGALIGGLVFLASGILFARHRTYASARGLFLVSIFYLPLIGLLMVWDRMK